MVDIVQLQMLPEDEPPTELHVPGNICTCATGELMSNPFCTDHITG